MLKDGAGTKQVATGQALPRLLDLIGSSTAKVSVEGGGRGAAVIQWCLAASLVMRG